MVPTLRTIMNSSYYYEYQENIHVGVKLIPHYFCTPTWIPARFYWRSWTFIYKKSYYLLLSTHTASDPLFLLSL